MYISMPNKEELFALEVYVDSCFMFVEKARQMLGEIWENYFSDYNQKVLHEREAELIGDTIYLVDQILWEAGLEYAILTEHENFPGYDVHIQSCENILNHKKAKKAAAEREQ